MRHIGGFSLLRFYAALSVLFGHYLHSFPEIQPARTTGLLDALFRLALIEGNAVRLFFVLAGFFLALRLLNEQSKIGSISVSKFYAARIFRIYPLYFCIFIVGCLILPIIMPSPVTTIDSVSTIALATFTTNIAMSINGGHVLSHLWSIAAQEQFNLIALMLLIRGFSTLKISIGVIAAWFFVATAAEVSNNRTLWLLADYTKFDALALGALAGWAYHTKHPILRVFEWHWMRYFIYACFASLAIIQIYSSSQLVIAAIASPIYAALVLCVAQQNITESAWKTRLGSLSYGIYIWHYPLLYMLMYVRISGTTLLFATIGLTLFAATLTYNLVEIPFNRFRSRISLTYIPEASLG